MTWELPKGWTWSTIGEICHNPQYGWTTKASETGYLKLLRTSDITTGCINWETVPYCQNEPEDKERFLLKDGDIVISRAGSIGHSLLIKSPRESVFASYLIRFRPLIDKNFVAYFLKSPYYWNLISESKIGIAVPNVNATKLKQVSIPIAPLAEQHRIVAKIEEWFTKLDACVETLKNVQTQLKRYRQSVLKAAVEGKLTAEWREKHKDELEPADILLGRIQNERKSKLGEKYKKPIPINNSDLPVLPEGWKWITMEHIAIKITDGEHLRPKMVSKGVPFLSAKNVQENGVIFDEKLYVGRDDATRFWQRCNPERNDILIVSRGATVGRTCIVNTDKEFCLLGSVILVKPSRLISGIYLKYILKSSDVQKAMRGLSGSTAQQAIYIRDIRNLLIPIAPINEQEIMINKIERIFSNIEEVDLIIKTELKRAQSLRHSILKRAFEGKLVPQDPNDQPASVLLERIKGERSKPKKSKQLEIF